MSKNYGHEQFKESNGPSRRNMAGKSNHTYAILLQSNRNNNVEISSIRSIPRMCISLQICIEICLFVYKNANGRDGT